MRSATQDLSNAIVLGMQIFRQLPSREKIGLLHITAAKPNAGGFCGLLKSVI
jgi:hypothetical protein